MVRTPAVMSASKGGRTPACTPGEPKGRKENIVVTVRVRPISINEQAQNDEIVLEIKDDQTLLLKHTIPDLSTDHTYNFDKVFDPACSTEEVYNEGAKDLALSPPTGVNATIFAYGQKSSGKTFTMKGITENAVKDIYEYFRKNPERVFVLKFSALEIYNETVIDLLNRESGPLRLLDDPERGIIVDELVEEVASDRNHLRSLIGKCEAQSQVGETALNGTSSRSHKIIRLVVESHPHGNLGYEKSLRATLNLVDICGIDGASHVEASFLNLTTLIQKLSVGKEIGNSRTAMICTVSPAQSKVESSRSILSFATCAREFNNVAELKKHRDHREWSDLPYELLNRIHISLQNLDSIRFRITCKDWEKPEITAIRSGLPPLGLEWQQKSPMLMYYSAYSQIYRFVQPVSGDTYENHFPELDHSTIRCSRFGWLLMARSQSSLFFFNPLLIPPRTINLPLSEHNLTQPSSTFTAPPTCHNCQVIILGSSSDSITLCRCCRGQPKWNVQIIVIDFPFEVAPCNPVFVGDMFLQLDTMGKLAALRLSDEGQITVAFPENPKGLNTAYASTRYIGEHHGKVIMVVVNTSFGTPVQVLELVCEGQEAIWMPVSSLGKHALFLSGSSNIMVPINTIGLEDRIYFKRITASNKDHMQECVFYSLKDEMYHSSWTRFFGPDWNGTEDLPLDMATWIQTKGYLQELHEDRYNWEAQLDVDEGEDDADKEEENRYFEKYSKKHIEKLYRIRDLWKSLGLQRPPKPRRRRET